MSTDGDEEIKKKVADGDDAMDVDSFEVGEKAQLGKEEQPADNSQKMEVDEGRPQVSDDEDLQAKKEDGKGPVEVKTGEGENHDVSFSVGDDSGGVEADRLVNGVKNHSLEEKGSNKAPLADETNNDASQPLESQRDEKLGGSSNIGTILEDHAQHESEKDENPEKMDNGAEGLKASVQHESEKDENPDKMDNTAEGLKASVQHESEKDENPDKMDNGAGGLKASVQNGTKKEELSNEMNSLYDSKEEALKREVTIAKVAEPKRGLSALRLIVHEETKREPPSQLKERLGKPNFDIANETDVRTPPPVRSFLGDPDVDGYESGTEEEQRVFARELDVFHKERGIDFRPPKFYQEQLNLLKLWRWVIKLGGYEQVTSCKLWRQVGESFRPPKTCTTVSWTFRGFYEKTLLEYEKQKILNGELPEIDCSTTDSMAPGTQGGPGQPSGSGRAIRDSAARAMQGWHSLRVSSNGEVGDPIMKDKNSMSLGKRERQLKSIAGLKRPKQSPVEHAAKAGHLRSPKPQLGTMVADAGPPADWVKINVHRTSDCYEVYALVPGLLREEVCVQSDPAGRLVILGQPENLDNPWGVTPFKKIVSLPTRIDPHQTSAVVTLHGQLFVRVPFEQSDN